MSKLFRFGLLITVFAISVVSCNPDENIIVDFPPNVTLRIENQTGHDINTIFSNSENFEDLVAGAVSEYIGFERIYQWPEITFQANEHMYEWTSPIDNVGFWAAVYENGAYTLVITDFDDASPFGVEAQLVED